MSNTVMLGGMEFCRWCKQPVRAMVRKGTGFCSPICRDSYAETCEHCGAKL